MTPIIVTETREIAWQSTNDEMERFWLLLCDSATSSAVMKVPIKEEMSKFRVTVTVEVLE